MQEGTFKFLLSDIIDKMTSGHILHYGRKFNKLTIANYQLILNTMNDHDFDFDVDACDLNESKSRKDRLRICRLLQTNVNDYLNILLEECYHPNTRKNHLKIIRATLKKAEAFYGYDFPKLQSMRELQTDVIALDPEHVQMIHQTKPEDESLHRVWYYTRLCLYSCMRISDLINFQNTIDDGIVTIITKKGVGSLSTFYIPKDVQEFLAERNGLGMKPQIFREKLRELMRSYPELRKQKVIYKYNHNGDPYAETKFLWQLITPHKLRSSGITYHLSNGLSEMEVRNISGHANGSLAFYRYVKASDKDSIRKQKENSKLLINS